MPQQDPSTQVNPFATRLAEALAGSDLSLQRVRARLAEKGLAVSTATLSYWSSGRSQPSRERSMAIVQELEHVLGLQDGRLVDTLPARGECQQATGAILGRDEVLRQAMEEHHLLRAAGWKYLVAHHRVVVGADGAEKSSESSYVMRALVGGQRGWTSVYDGHDGRLVPTGVAGVRVNREFELADDLRVAEYVFDEPAARGQTVVATTRASFPGFGDLSTSCGFALANGIDLLTLEVVFQGDLPARIHRSHRPSAEDEATTVDEKVMISAGTAQAVVTPAASGLHQLVWEW